MVGGIKSCEVLANRARCLLGLRPGNGLIPRQPLLLASISSDQARIDRKTFATNQPSRDALSNYALKYPAQRVALAKALMPGAAEHRMVRYPILDAKLAKPPIGQVDLYLRAQPPLRADRKHVAYNQHPDHQHRIDRRPARVRVVRRKLLVHPIKIENAVDLPDQMIRRHYLVEIERVEEFSLSAFSPPHHRPLPRIIVLFDGITVQRLSQPEFCNMG